MVFMSRLKLIASIPDTGSTLDISTGLVQDTEVEVPVILLVVLSLKYGKRTEVSSNVSELPPEIVHEDEDMSLSSSEMIDM
jgi:hypothetical protein